MCFDMIKCYQIISYVSFHSQANACLVNLESNTITMARSVVILAQGSRITWCGVVWVLSAMCSFLRDVAVGVVTAAVLAACTALWRWLQQRPEMLASEAATESVANVDYARGRRVNPFGLSGPKARAWAAGCRGGSHADSE